MIPNQRHQFKIPESVSYLNGAYMSPMLKSVEKIGHDAVSKKCLPFEIFPEDFFTDTNLLKKEFAKLIEVDNEQNIAIIPSVSYGIATVANNISLNAGDEIIIVDEQFPSNVYSWQKLAEKFDASVKIVKPPLGFNQRGENWNKLILDAIQDNTALVAVPQVHWADGTLFDLQLIRNKTKNHDALLIIDGTQSVGAMPFSVKQIQPDALICSGYKWLLGPYSIGLAYYSDTFKDGNPIEENWINRKNSEDFKSLVNYESRYQPASGRYNVGEMSNFTLTPMLIAAIAQIIKWQPERIQDYCKAISSKTIEELKILGCKIESDKYKANHLFGIYIPDEIDKEKLKSNFSKNNIFVSFRGSAIRVSLNVYNTENDFEKLIHCFKQSKHKQS